METGFEISQSCAVQCMERLTENDLMPNTSDTETMRSVPWFRAVCIIKPAPINVKHRSTSSRESDITGNSTASQFICLILDVLKTKKCISANCIVVCHDTQGCPANNKHERFFSVGSYLQPENSPLSDETMPPAFLLIRNRNRLLNNSNMRHASDHIVL